MKCLVHEGEVFIVTRRDNEISAVRPVDPDKVSIFNQKASGEITIVTRREPWLYKSLKQMRKDDRNGIVG